jgi:hypothetical protein
MPRKVKAKHVERNHNVRSGIAGRKRRGSGRETPREGKIRYALAMWLLGLPLPIILIALFVKGCDW